jgi:oligopeptidase B
MLIMNTRRYSHGYGQFLSSIQETDYTTPALKTAPTGKGYWYYTRFEAGESYPTYCRAPQSSADELFPPPVNEGWDEKIVNSNNETSLGPLLPGEEVYLDVPALARDRTYLATGAIAISPDQKYVAYTLDEKGGETCQLYLKHIESGKVWTLLDQNVDRSTTDSTDLLECDGSVVWNDASDALFYVTMDETHRPHKLYCRRIFDSDGHWIDAEDQNDELLMAEDDELYNLRIAKSFDGRYLLVRSSSKESSEVHYLDLRPEMGSQGMSLAKNLVCIAKRKHKVLYRVTHCQGYWLVQTNIGGLPNLSLKACRVGEEGMETWRDVVNSDTDTPVPVFDGGHARSLDVSDNTFPRTSI